MREDAFARCGLFLNELALDLAWGRRLSRADCERRGRRRFLFAVSRAAGDEDSAHPGQRDEHGCAVAGAVDVDRRISSRHPQESGSRGAHGHAGFLGGTAGAIVLLNTPQRTFLHLVPWLLLVAATIFAVSGPVSRWLEGASIGGAHARAAATAGVSVHGGCLLSTSATSEQVPGFDHHATVAVRVFI